MGVMQWLLLILAVIGVVGVYILTKHREGPNPWRNMQNPDTAGGDDDLGQPAHGDDPQQSFSGVLGADDIPDLPVENDAPMEEDAGSDLPEFEVRTSPRQESLDESQHDLNPAGLKRSGASAAVDESDQRIIVLHVAAREGDYFSGGEVHKALQACKLQFGMREVYHRITEVNGVPESVFSVANMLKPGFLNPDEADQLQTPGLTLFMILPGPMDGVRALKDMMETANELAEQLGGDVLDDKRVLLKRQTAQFLLDEVAEDERKLRLKSRHG